MTIFNLKLKLCVAAALAAYFVNTPVVRADLVLEQQKVAPSAVDTAEAVNLSNDEQPSVSSAPVAKKAPLVIEQKTSPTVIVQDDQQIVAPVSGTVIPVGPAKSEAPTGTAAILQKMEDNNKSVLRQMEMKRIEQEERFGKSIEASISGAAPAPQADTMTGVAAAPAAAAPAPAPAAQQPTYIAVPVKEEFVGSMKKDSDEEDDEDDYDHDSRSRSSAKLKDLAEEEAEENEKTLINVFLGGGFPVMSVSNMYNVSGRYATSVGVGAEIGDHLGVDGSYAYNVYGIGLTQYNPYLNYYGYAVNNSYEPYALKQNVFDAGLKIFLVGRKNTLRPYFGGGLAYSKGFVNYDAQNPVGPMGPGPDYEISSFLGMIRAGLDLKVSKNFTVGAQGKYYTVFTSNENQQLNNAALYYGPSYGAYPIPTSPGAAEKQALGGSLVQSSFYTILLNASLSF